MSLKSEATISLEEFVDPDVTAKGEQRAWVDLIYLRTVWFNTGTVCNLECKNCYIESSPTNDRLVYITLDEVKTYLDEIRIDNLGTEEIALTGGEPFMNPDIIGIIEESLSCGFDLLILTNAMKPMEHKQKDLLRLKDKYSEKLRLRISIDHFSPELHEEERGDKSWSPMVKGLKWLSDNGFNIDVAGRTRWDNNEKELRKGYADLFTKYNIEVNAFSPTQLTLFPEINEHTEMPEITTKCWDILGVSPDDIMCATSRMVVKHKGSKKPTVASCTLLCDGDFNMGTTLKEASSTVKLNHPHCAEFCVLGGGSCNSS